MVRSGTIICKVYTFVRAGRRNRLVALYPFGNHPSSGMFDRAELYLRYIKPEHDPDCWPCVQFCFAISNLYSKSPLFVKCALQPQSSQFLIVYSLQAFINVLPPQNPVGEGQFVKIASSSKALSMMLKLQSISEFCGQEKAARKESNRTQLGDELSVRTLYCRM